MIKKIPGEHTCDTNDTAHDADHTWGGLDFPLAPDEYASVLYRMGVNLPGGHAVTGRQRDQILAAVRMNRTLLMGFDAALDIVLSREPDHGSINLDRVPTLDIMTELVRREGVSATFLGPYDELTKVVYGPAWIIVNQD